MNNEQLNKFAPVAHLITKRLFKENLHEITQGQIIDIILDLLAEKFPVNEQTQEKIEQLTIKNKELNEKYKQALERTNYLTETNELLNQGNRPLLEEIDKPSPSIETSQDSKVLDLIEQVLEMR